MKKIYILILLSCCILLVACSEDNPTAVKSPSPAPNRTVTTIATVQVTSGVAPVTTIAIANTASSAVPSNIITIPASGNYSGSLEVFKKVFEATGKANSYRFSVVSTGVSLSGVFVKPDRISGNLETGGQKAQVVLIGKDFYFSVDGKTWQKNSGDSSLSDITARLNEVIPSNLAGSLFYSQNDEKLDGKDVGVFAIETDSASALSTTINKTRLTYKYDKQTFQVALVQVKSGSNDAEIRYSDYDNPTHKVEAPA
ncbi:hypothetical protein [Candidatus Chlorohelix sp.]|uniref:hypothetical protein n=1 Tax=Candidatus Chlorohelix sp. TaxID=3139201 RepID=UPI00306282A9